MIPEPYSRRRLWIILAGLGAFLAAAWSLDQGGYLDRGQQVFQQQTVPAPILRYGRLGQILRDNGLVVSDMRSDTRSLADEGERYHPTVSVFQRKRGRSDRLVRVNRTKGSTLDRTIDSTAIMRADMLSDDIPTVSLYVADDDLRDPDYGILANWEESLERPAQFSIFNDGKLDFASYCGVKLHGNSSRKNALQRKHCSFRLYFRQDYGLEGIRAGALLDAKTGKVCTLVLRASTTIATVLAFDLGRAMDVLAPAVTPVRFYLNGEPSRLPYYAMDHISQRQWEQQLGHSDFKLYKLISKDRSRKEQALHDEMTEWAKSLGRDICIEDVAQRLDIDDFMRGLFVLFYTAVADWGEGTGLLNLRDENPRWKWILWDLDRAWLVATGAKLNEGDIKPHEKRFLELGLDPPAKADDTLRATLFLGLALHDSEFRKQFAHLSQDMLNHVATESFLNGRSEYWETVVPETRISTQFFKVLRGFARKRAVFVRDDISAKFGMAPAVECTILVRSGQEFLIDGYSITEDYAGWYFPEFPLTLEAIGERADRFAHWIVNGERIDERLLSIGLTEGTEISAIYRKHVSDEKQSPGDK